MIFQTFFFASPVYQVFHEPGFSVSRFFWVRFHGLGQVLEVNDAKQLFWNHTSALVFSCKYVAYFQNCFSLFKRSDSEHSNE